MKSLLYSLFFVCALIATCYCDCGCEPNDTDCIRDCVVEANDCVSSCNDDTECYQSCIDEKWPAEDDSNDKKEPTHVFKNVFATTTTITNTVLPSPSASQATSASATAKNAEASHASSSTVLKCATAQLVMCLFISLIYISL